MSTTTWNGVIRDNSIRSLAPTTGFIADEETWAKVWSAWRENEERPQVDFLKEIVLVATVDGPNRVHGAPALNEGNVKFFVGSTLLYGPGFGYLMVKISIEGVKTINGKPFGSSDN
jgi:hypothetical protein